MANQIRFLIPKIQHMQNKRKTQTINLPFFSGAKKFSAISINCRMIPFFLLLLPVSAWSADWTPLPDTGQTVCYDTHGAETDCPAAGQPLFGQDAHFQDTPPSYLVNANQTVTDVHTGLTWIESGEDIKQTWEDAISYCQELDFADQSDWRLPEKFELESIVDYSKSYPAINPVFSCESSFYWSTTPHMPNPAYAWSVFCPDGADHWVHKSNAYNVRCVRTER